MVTSRLVPCSRITSLQVYCSTVRYRSPALKHIPDEPGEQSYGADSDRMSGLHIINLRTSFGAIVQCIGFRRIGPSARTCNDRQQERLEARRCFRLKSFHGGRHDHIAINRI